jgi:two-component system chemotaxis response regulator CheB
MVSSLTEQGAKETLTALDLGAVDYIPKQLHDSAVNIVGIQQELIDKVVAAHRAGAKLHLLARHGNGNGNGNKDRLLPPSACLPAGTALHARGTKVVAIGCSTGGPKALLDILPLFPEDFPAPILVVQHMPKFFTGPFAERLNQLSRIEVREAAEGDALKPGLALIAPGGLHMRVKRLNALESAVSLSPEPVTLHRPSVDVMMESVADAFTGRAVGVILTGMGHDGRDGMQAIKKAQGRTIAQDEATCVVYGMPKAVVENGTADKIVPLGKIAGEIANMV